MRILCPCGSGQEHRACHPATNFSAQSPGFVEAAREALRKREAEDLLRQYQQGFGRPIISETLNGFRIVAIGSQIKWSLNWLWFTDFLLDHMKDKLGRPWATQAMAEKLDHPIFRWLRLLNDKTIELRRDGKGTISTESVGFLSALFRLGYALYLIEHHDQLDRKLINRLRNPTSFRATYYETLLAAAFSVSGAKISMAEINRSSSKTPEFWATCKSGKRYAIEAKCKKSWKSLPAIGSLEFYNELRQWIRDQLYNASKKKLTSPVYCFEMSIPIGFEEKEWHLIYKQVREAICEAESITVEGQVANSAYIIVTNNRDLVNDDATGLNHVAMLTGFRMDNFGVGVEVPLDTAMEWHDAHRDVRWVLQCMEDIEQVPVTFDGTPPELEIALREGKSVLRLGQKLEIDLPDGGKIFGTVRDVCSAGDNAHIVLEGADGAQQLVQIPLSAHEAESARKYGDAVFGKPEKRKRDLGDDPLALYDWFLEVYSSFSEESLLRQIPNHKELKEISDLSRQEMVVRVAREVTKAAVSMAKKDNLSVVPEHSTQPTP